MKWVTLKKRFTANTARQSFYMRTLLTILSAYIFCPVAQAVTITSTGSQYEPAGVRHFFTVSDWGPESIGRSWCSNSSSEKTSCSLSISGMNTLGHQLVGSDYIWRSLPTTSNTMGGLYNQLQKKGFSTPFHGSLLVPKDRAPSAAYPLCISFTAAFTGPNSGGAFTPVGPCGATTLPPIKCELSGQSTISHGSLSDDKVDGHTASTQLIAECTGISEIKIFLVDVESEGIQLRKDGSLYSKISINNKAVNKYGAQFTINNKLNLNITSQLSKNGELAPGEFSGFAVLRVTAP